jgi:hypothetical protein
MSDEHKLIITGIKWNYLHSREVPAITPPSKGAPQAIVAYCTDCGTLFNASDDGRPNRFVSIMGAIHLRHQCGLQEQFHMGQLQDAHP